MNVLLSACISMVTVLTRWSQTTMSLTVRILKYLVQHHKRNKYLSIAFIGMATH